MAQRICSIDDCSRKAVARGWCHKHWSRWKRNGHMDLTIREKGAPPPPCKIDTCQAPGDAGYGWCDLHYRRWTRNGDPLDSGSRIVGDDVARFESYVKIGVPPAHDPDLGECWLWTGLLTGDGYAVMISDLPTASAHRWSYRHHVGALPPEGWDLDHLCRVRCCVNPWHLEPVPHVINVQRANAVTAERKAAAA